MNFRSGLAVFILIAVGCLTAEAACTPNFPDSLGKIIAQKRDRTIRLIDSKKGGVKTVECCFIVQASRTSCIAAITDFAHYPEFIPNIKKSARPDSARYPARWSFALDAGPMTVNYTIDVRESVAGDTWTLEWTYVSGDIESTTGSWNVTECDGGNGGPKSLKVLYLVRVSVGKFVPSWLSSRLTVQSIPGLITAVQERAEKNKSVKPGR